MLLGNVKVCNYILLDPLTSECSHSHWHTHTHIHARGMCISGFCISKLQFMHAVVSHSPFITLKDLWLQIDLLLYRKYTTRSLHLFSLFVCLSSSICVQLLAFIVIAFHFIILLYYYYELCNIFNKNHIRLINFFFIVIWIHFILFCAIITTVDWPADQF